MSAVTGQKVRWGILATGGMAARFTADLVDLPDAEVVAVASRTEASAKTFAERFGIPRAYGGWETLARDEDVDVVYVATPHSAHRTAAGLCLEAGRNVLCEKPFTLTRARRRNWSRSPARTASSSWKPCGCTATRWCGA